MQASVSFQIFLKNPINEDMFRMISSAGFKRCELWSMGEHVNYRDKKLREKIKMYSEKYNVLLDTAHLPLHTNDFKISLGDKEIGKKSLDELLYASEFLDTLDVKTYVIHVSGDLEIFHKNFSKLYYNSEKNFAFENDPMGFPLTKDIPKILEDLKRELRDSEKRLGACLDIGHANIWEKPPEKTVIELGKSIIATHISDNDGKYDLHVPPGEGNINWDEVLKAFKTIEYKHNFTFEISPSFEYEQIPKVLERLKNFCEQNNILI
ncbi:MAG: sugar phosphate isomerase/epimerase [bacterium]|nr:sugar phosphate isomerase/epimerase [bacterium]